MYANARFLLRGWHKKKTPTKKVSTHRVTRHVETSLAGVFLIACSVLLLLTAAEPGYARPTQRSVSTASQALAMERDVLNNIMQNGFDGNPGINNGLGGLWVNWIYGTNPLQTNLNGSG
ncbi:MAG TPA: hypothetical protein VH593_24450, partial [Ktedonobacteraceae bacterium]